MVSSKLRPLTNPLTERLFGRLPLSPNFFTTLNLLFGAVAGYLIYAGRLPLSAPFILLSGLCDSIDGAIARARGGSQLGRVLDAVFDRLSEGFIFMGMATRDFLAVPALVISYAISHTGVKEPRASKGLAERTERVVLMFAFLLFGQLHALLLLLNVLLPVTLFQRLWSVRNL